MHTVHLLTVSPSMHCAGGVCLARAVCIAGGSPCQGGLLAKGGLLARESALPWGSPCQGGVCLARGISLLGGLGVSLPGEWYPSMHWGRHSPLWTEFLTHATENITLPQTSFVGGKKDVHWRQPHRLHVSCPTPSPHLAAGSATETLRISSSYIGMCQPAVEM